MAVPAHYPQRVVQLQWIPCFVGRHAGLSGSRYPLYRPGIVIRMLLPKFSFFNPPVFCCHPFLFALIHLPTIFSPVTPNTCSGSLSDGLANVFQFRSSQPPNPRQFLNLGSFSVHFLRLACQQACLALKIVLLSFVASYAIEIRIKDLTSLIQRTRPIIFWLYQVTKQLRLWVNVV